MVEREAFGPRLRRERERRQISLADIAESTKISQSLFAGLERNDVSRWPRGIFRRAFIREYAAAIGLPIEPVVAEFLRLFPESGPSPRDSTVRDFQDAAGLRLTLAIDRWRWLVPTAIQVFAAAIDLCGVFLIGGGLAWLTGASLWMTISIVGLSYYTLATACVGRSPVFWLFQVGMPLRIGSSTAPSVGAGTASRKLFHIVQRSPHSQAEATQQETKVAEKARVSSR